MADWSGSIVSFSPLDANQDCLATADSPGPCAPSAINTQPPGLLVSVRNLAEAISVSSMKIDVLDLKEPAQGPLAPTSHEVWDLVAAQTSGHVPLSAALGEFCEAVEIAAKVPKQFRFAKAGPSGCHSLPRLEDHWLEIRGRLNPTVELVAVAYADYEAASCPPPDQVFRLAAKLGFKTWLVDTFEKTGKSALDHLSQLELARISSLAKTHRTKWVLAGSIRLEMVEQSSTWAAVPDLFGVRGDVCTQGREGKISVPRVQHWLNCLQSTGNAANRKALNRDPIS